MKCTYINIWYIVAEAGSSGIVCMHVPPYKYSTEYEYICMSIHMYILRSYDMYKTNIQP